MESSRLIFSKPNTAWHLRLSGRKKMVKEFFKKITQKNPGKKKLIICKLGGPKYYVKNPVSQFKNLKSL